MCGVWCNARPAGHFAVTWPRLILTHVPLVQLRANVISSQRIRARVARTHAHTHTTTNTNHNNNNNNINGFGTCNCHDYDLAPTTTTNQHNHGRTTTTTATSTTLTITTITTTTRPGRHTRVAQYMLGAIYTEGIAVKKDERETAVWYRKAAEGGLKQAQYSQTQTATSQRLRGFKIVAANKSGFEMCFSPSTVQSKSRCWVKNTSRIQIL